MVHSALHNSDPAISRRDRLVQVIEHAGHVLPAQGPIGVFIHHNTLHAFEHLPFEEAVVEAARLFGAEPYMLEEEYREQIRKGRIQLRDLDAVLEEEQDANLLPRHGVSRRHLRRAVLTSGLRPFEANTMEWLVNEGGLLSRLRSDLDPSTRAKVVEEFDGKEHIAARVLFDACFARIRPSKRQEACSPKRLRDGLFNSAGVDLDDVIHPYLIRFSGAFLDQGLAYWPMPDRSLGFYLAVRALVTQPIFLHPLRLQGLREEFLRQAGKKMDAAEAVLDFLRSFQIPEQDWDAYLGAELLALPGWAGLMRRLEQEPHLLHHQPLPCSLLDFLAVRLTLTRVAAQNIAAESGLAVEAGGDWQGEQHPRHSPAQERLRLAARLFDTAQLLGLSASAVDESTDEEFEKFAGEVEKLDSLECRRLLQRAYERAHERLVLQPLAHHSRTHPPVERTSRPKAQVFFCIDEREESMRRHLEELDSGIETFAAAGFYGVAVDYAGIDDSHGVALCPVVIKPRHAVRELPVSADAHLHETRKSRRAIWSRFARGRLVASRTLVRGWLSTAALGILSLVPLIARVLAPRQFARLRESLNDSFLPEPRTELTLMRTDERGHEAAEGLLLGFAAEEKVERVESVLGPAGLRKNFARLVVVLGHGSTSLNNPHESAHDCGACGGRRGGPNARLFAAMANMPHVRERLRTKGIDIPSDTWFVGGYHDTCNDDVDLFDTESIPETHAVEFANLRALLDGARAWNAHERARRFEAANPNESPDLALLHVEERSEHLAEPRPEYGHCTNAVCIVGRRASTRGLFMDRRVFLTSYDASQDPDNRDLGRLLGAVIPVCAGISLEYYFSFVDNERYGCGTKLPHNVTGLIGVMNGHASDLRTGLPWQMVEIHEPVRILFVIETTPERLMATLEKNPAHMRLLVNRWIRLAAQDPTTGEIQVYRDGAFEPMELLEEPVPVAATSHAWYGGRTEHLPFATVTAGL